MIGVRYVPRNRSTPIPAHMRRDTTAAEDCAAAGLRLTPRRRALVVVLEDANAPISIESYHARLDALGLRTSRSTLYKLVADLLEAGVLTELLSREHRLYVLASRRRPDERGAASVA